MNQGADALSRIHEQAEFSSCMSYLCWEDHQLVCQEVQNDVKLKKIYEELQENHLAHPGFSIHQGTLLYKGRLVLSSTSTLIPKMLQEFHNTAQGGHSGFLRTYKRIAVNVYWPGMKNAIQNFIKSCDACQRHKYLAVSPGGLLQPLPIPANVWEDLSMDFITGLPKSKGYEAVMVVVDRLSKYSHFVPIKHPYTARGIAEIFTNEIVKSPTSDNIWPEHEFISGSNPHLTSRFCRVELGPITHSKMVSGASSKIHWVTHHLVPRSSSNSWA